MDICTQAEVDREVLWKLLDDIDTVSDMAKSDDSAYRRIVEGIQCKRNLIGYSPDGQTIIWREPAAPTKEGE